jgi:hypothetical protein
VRRIPNSRDVIRRGRVIERVPLAEKLGVGHLQFEGVALEKQPENCFELPRRPRDGALLLGWPTICLIRMIIDKAARCA